VLLKDNIGPDEVSQKGLLLRTIAEVSSQAIQRAMLITKHMKSQRLAAVTKTAIAANHEINSPLTTILLKLDMLMGEMQVSPNVKKALNEVKAEALSIRNVVKKMLEISDVVETSYTQHEKMLDLKQASRAQDPSARPQQAMPNDEAGFEDFIQTAARPYPKPQGAGSISAEQLPGFEDYLEDKPKAPSLVKGVSQKSGTNTDTPGFEDYLDK